MKARTASVFFVFFVYVVAANVPFWIASRSMGLLLTGVFNFELVVVGMLSVFLRRLVMVTLLAIALVLDILRGISSTYLLSPLEMIRSARYLFEYVPSHLVDVVAIALCIAVICLLATLAQDNCAMRQERVYAVFALGVFLVGVGAVDVHEGRTTVLSHGDYERSTLRLTRLPGHSLLMSEVMFRRLNSRRTSRGNVPVPAASRMMMRVEDASVTSHADAIVPNVVFILVESW